MEYELIETKEELEDALYASKVEISKTSKKLAIYIRWLLLRKDIEEKDGWLMIS